MLARTFLVLTVAIFVALVELAANGQINPYFACHSANSYDVILNRRDEIVLDNCSASATNEIIDHLRRSRLQGRLLRLNTMVANLTGIHLENITDFDLSDVNLSKIDLRSAERLSFLNLTFNKFRSLNSLLLRDNVTLVSIDMSHNRLAELQGASIPFTRKLYLRSNNIMQLDANLILPDALLELDLTRNEIENISLVAFSSSTLKILNLSINLINAVSNTTFACLPALQTLLLECNKIFDIEPNTFDRNGKLVELNLRDNNLSTLKKGVFDNLPVLQILDVSKNLLLRLTPDNVQNLNNLVHFSLSENAKLCRSQCKRDLQFLLMLGGRLKVLEMSRLRLRYFPVTLTTSIRVLNLSANKLTSVQTGDLENFPFLEMLDLSGNEVASAEKDVFSRLEYLRELYLQDNLLERVPSLLPASLRTLRLDGNRIRRISSTDFHHLSKLNTLTLNSNAIKSIDSDAFSSLSDLRILDISRNPIQELRTDAFEGANNLEIFHASGLHNVRVNGTDLRYFPISELPNLRYLNLSHSAEMVKSFLRDFPLLTTVKQLEVLDLDNANLTRVPSGVEHFLPRLRLLSLLGNPINCSDNSFSVWKEPYRLEARYVTDDNSTDLKVRISRHLVRPSSNRVTIRSRCPFTTDYTIVPRNDFWSSVLPKGTTTMATPSLIKRKKLSLRSLTKYAVSTTRRNSAAISTPVTNVATLLVDSSSLNSTQLPIESTSAEFLAYSANNTPSGERTSSFFDWFPSLNESAADHARVAMDDSEESGLKNTHPGVVIFLFVSGFILVAFGSLIAPPCVQTYVYKWRWRQHERRSQIDNQNQANIEISSISAFVETEICLD